MSWLPLSDRLNQLPLILAGPILRRTEPDAVTVWVALRAPCEVVLKVYSTKNGNAIAQVMLEGVRSTIALGKHLHIVAVTAKSSNERRLKSGQIYAYDLNFDKRDRGKYGSVEQVNINQNLQQALHSTLLPHVPISYFDHQLPTFALPPKDLNLLQIVHGSCRKPHGEGQDALAILDDLIEHNAELSDSRPHQLFFTGDQIYGDDVADPLLLALTEAGDTLLGWEENLPIVQPHLTTYLKPKQLRPGQRSKVAEKGGLTAGLKNQPERAKSHLFSFGEYCAVYLFLWSQTLWSERFPKGQDVCNRQKLAKLWDKEVRLLKGFIHTLWKARRALANVPTYMIFDDHDISDDWYINQAWCLRVLAKPLGRRVVRNGLLAYAVFQAWGNTPNQFQDGQSGEKLLTAAKNWSVSAGTDDAASDAMARYIGLPDIEPNTGLPKMRLDGDVLILDRDRSALNWHYTIRSYCHEVVVLDTRTWRGYPSGQAAVCPPRLLSPTAFERQIREPLKQTDDSLAVFKGDVRARSEFDAQLKKVGSSSIEATIVIAPTNLFSLQVIDWIQHWNLKQHKVYQNDVGDGWNINKAALAKLLVTLFEQRDRVVILSGDIHYGSAICLNHWSCHYPEPSKIEDFEQPHVLAQLTSSAFKNSEWKTRLVHTKVKSLIPERRQIWIGWNDPPQLLSIPIIQGRTQIRKFSVPVQGRDIGQLQNLRGNLTTAWVMKVSNRQFPPEWLCHIEWIKRQPAQTILCKQASWLKSSNRSQTRSLNWITDLFKLLWRNRWLQEGKEVVGLANIGVVRFDWKSNNAQKAVIQDLYWYPPWKQNSIVYSRFYLPLQLKDRL